MQNQSKQIPIADVLSLTTGCLLGKFLDMHLLAAFVAGRPIHTHEFTEKAFWKKLREAVYAQHPSLRDVKPLRVINRKAPEAEVNAYIAEQSKLFGAVLEIFPGSDA